MTTRTNPRETALPTAPPAPEANSTGDEVAAEERPVKRERSYNKITLLGRIGRDPDGRYLEDGTLVVTTSLAVNTYPNSSPDWFQLVFWRTVGDLALQLLNKGARVFVEGHARTRTYTDANGARRTSFQVEVLQFVIVASPSAERNGATTNGHATEAIPA